MYTILLFWFLFVKIAFVISILFLDKKEKVFESPFAIVYLGTAVLLFITTVFHKRLLVGSKIIEGVIIVTGIVILSIWVYVAINTESIEKIIAIVSLIFIQLIGAVISFTSKEYYQKVV